MKRSDQEIVDQEPLPDPLPDLLPSDFDPLKLSKWGLDWGDISLIRWKLSLTPTERVRTAQSFVDTAFKLRNAKRA